MRFFKKHTSLLGYYPVFRYICPVHTCEIRLEVRNKKDLLSLVFTSIATVLMLAGTVLPHHHHGHAVCFDISHCSLDDEGEKGCCGDAHRGPVHTDSEAQCTLNINFYIQADDNDNVREGHFSMPDGTSSLPDLTCFIAAEGPRVPENTATTLHGAHFAAISHLSGRDYVVSSGGLRAPPFFLA